MLSITFMKCPVCNKPLLVDSSELGLLKCKNVACMSEFVITYEQSNDAHNVWLVVLKENLINNNNN